MGLDPQRYIRVCDDNGQRAANWADDINAIPGMPPALRAEPLGVEEFASAFEALKVRQRRARHRDDPLDQPDLAELDPLDELDELDEAELVVSDFDLTPADGATDLAPSTLKTLSGSFGDIFAYMLRNFTGAAYTVLANQAFFQSTFDLSHMRFATSNADLNVAGDDLRRPELWTGTSDGNTYRPWHWPRLLDEPTRRRALADSLDLDAPVLITLGLADEPTMAQFAPEQIEFLGPSPETVTFREVTTTAGKFSRSTEHERIPDRYLSKAAVSVVCHWLERIVMPAQNVTIDAPHLAQRRPGVLSRHDRPEWDALCDLSDADRVRSYFDADILGTAELPGLTGWTSRPVWAWHRIPRNVPRGPSGQPVVFCEDVSAFHPLDDAWEYESSVPGPHTQRFVRYENVDADGYDIDYWPQRRLFG